MSADPNSDLQTVRNIRTVLLAVEVIQEYHRLRLKRSSITRVARQFDPNLTRQEIRAILALPIGTLLDITLDR